jgi:large subunit ribosomal protein L22
MSTASAERQEVRAVAKWVRISPRKARLVVDHIRGRTVPEARTVLAFTTRAAAREIEKVLRSAVANAEANHGLVGDDLVVTTAHVDDGLIIKRWKPRARGRVARIKKRTCHITIKVSPLDGIVAPPRPARPPAPAVEEEEAPKAELAAKPRARKTETEPKAEKKEAAKRPVRASGPGEGARGSREVPPTKRPRRKRKDEES